ncbi:asparaginase [Glaciihabitans sp. dw_435]|uniref:asparaginase n=1 Tax=Glaciihabitans sp. dw_435 TaxID=2720081 RepID=UPI001BD2EE01|nr:asparaginase [Glaciihabitans sp. dw_435]
MIVAPRPLTADGSVELAVLERSGWIESRHLGAAIVVDATGEVLRSLGDTSALIYPRSTLKPLQAIAVQRAGATLEDEQLVLSTASHAGTPEHVRVVRAILASAGIGEDALGCPADWPGDPASRAAVYAAGGASSPIYMNCSGKHAAFLLACVRNEWPVEGYLEPGHPLQSLVRSVVEEFTGESIEHSGVDGCGAPVHAVSLTGLARAVGKVTGGGDTDGARLTAAILENPWAIDGPGRANTVVIENLGIVAKLGAEGVMIMGTADGTAVAVKILDGSLRAATLVALTLLVSVGAVDQSGADAVLAATLEKVTGGAELVGDIHTTFEV